MKTIFIYALCDPRTLEVRYIGKSDDPYKRYCRHLLDQADTHKARWIRSLIKEGLLPIRQIVEECDESQWESKEREWITFYKNKLGCNLTNETPGGGGGGMTGKCHSAITRKKLSNANKGIRIPESTKNKIRKKLKAMHGGPGSFHFNPIPSEKMSCLLIGNKNRLNKTLTQEKIDSIKMSKSTIRDTASSFGISYTLARNIKNGEWAGFKRSLLLTSGN